MVTAIVMMLVLGAILGLGLGIADRFLSVEVDERIEKVSSMGEVTVVGTCKPCKPDQKAAIAEYLNTTPGPDGTCVKVKA